MKIILIGDICGKTGRRLLSKHLERLREALAVDWVIANGENATGGIGLSPKHAKQVFAAGVDLITSGNHIFERPDWHEVVKPPLSVLRPHNLGGEKIPGSGWRILKKSDIENLLVINLAGRVFMDHGDCPLICADRLIASAEHSGPVVIDFHAEATSEKQALAWYLDGRASLVAGTHTHVQTSDARILPGGTGVISDIGMTGPADGVIGVDREIVINRFVDGFSEKFIMAPGPGKIEGVFAEISDKKTFAIRPFRLQENDPIDMDQQIAQLRTGLSIG